jgi:hypothetical protein
MARAQSGVLLAFSGRFVDLRWFCALCCFNAVIFAGNLLRLRRELEVLEVSV